MPPIFKSPSVYNAYLVSFFCVFFFVFVFLKNTVCQIVLIQIRPSGYKTFSMLNSAEQEINIFLKALAGDSSIIWA